MFRTVRVVVRNMDAMTDKIIMTHPIDSVENFKAKVEDKFLIPFASQKLVLRTTELTHGNMLSYFSNEQEEFVLHVRDLRIGQIFIATPSGRHALLEFVPSLPVRVLKHRINTIEGLEYMPRHKMRLTYAGRELSDDRRRLSEYNVQDEATVHLSLRIAGGSETENEDEDEDDPAYDSHGLLRRRHG